MAESVYTVEDKSCLNCQHMVRSKNPFQFLLMLTGDDRKYYLCLTPDRIHTHRDIVTGKITISKKPKSCRDCRATWSDCNEAGKHWKPSKAWREKKENLFKQIVSEEK